MKTFVDLITFLRTQDVATLASVRYGGIPHVAAVYYYVDDKGNFYFLSRDTTRKWKNVIENPHVALVVTDTQSVQTVQVEGEAQEVDYTHEYAGTMKDMMVHLERHGKKWEESPIQHQNAGYFIFVKITPTWIRWSSYSEWNDTIQFEYRK